MNDSYGKKLIQIIKDNPNTTVNKLYNDYKRRGLIVDHSKSGLFSKKEFENLLTLKTEFIKNSGVEMDGDLREMDMLFNAIADNNEEYELMQALKKKAEKDAGIKDGTVVKRLGMDTDVQKKYISNLKAYTQSNDISKEVIIADYNNTEDRKNNYNAVFRSKIRLLAERNGLNDSSSRYAVNNTMGGKSGSFGDKTITKEQSDRIDWDNSLVTLIPGKQNSVVKLRLSSKDKDKSLNLEGFKDGYAYLTVDNQLANEILAPKGLSVDSFFASKNIFTSMNAIGLSRQTKNEILGKGTLGIRSLPIGNTRASYQIEARDDNEYFIKMNIAGTEISKRTTIPKELLRSIEIQTSDLYRQMRNSPNYSTQEFNKKAVNLIKIIINN
jgi:effector-binding domain-containing protein